MRMGAVAVVVAISGVLAPASIARADEPAELRPLAFLIGEWDSSGGGQPGSGAGTAVFSRSLQDRVIVRTSFAEYPASGGMPPTRHDDFMIIYATPAGVRADYYDSEGHVIRYGVTSPAAGRAVFLSALGIGEPTYRLTYTLTPNGIMEGEFEIADPGTTAFKPYLTWQSRRISKRDGQDAAP